MAEITGKTKRTQPKWSPPQPQKEVPQLKLYNSLTRQKLIVSLIIAICTLDIHIHHVPFKSINETHHTDLRTLNLFFGPYTGTRTSSPFFGPYIFINKFETEMSRERSLTEKGRQYQLDIRHRDREKCLKFLDTLTNRLYEAIDNGELGTIKGLFRNWLGSYEELLSINEEYQSLLDPDTLRTDSEWFNSKLSGFTHARLRAEQFLGQHAPPLGDDQASLHSQQSSLSRVSSERIKESQRQAELTAKASSLAEKQKLEQERLELDQREEELQLRTELNISRAKSQALEEIERSLNAEFDKPQRLQEDGDRHTTPTEQYQQSPNKQVTVDKTYKFPEKSLFHNPQNVHPPNMGRNPPNHVNIPNVSNTITPGNVPNPYLDLSSLSRDLNKPKADIQKFDGSPMDYNRFLRQFETRVCANTNSYDERLTFLLQYTSGEPHKIVQGYSNLDAKQGYKATFQEFNERYGNPDVIARAYVNKALQWPSIKDSAKALDEFGIFLRECYFAVKNIDAIKVLEYSENLKSLVRKLPFYLHDRWRNVAYDLNSKNKVVRFEHLVDFVRKEAKKAVDPIFGKDTLGGNKENRNKLKKIFVTNTNASYSCSYCQGQHCLDLCPDITKIPLKERYSFLKSKGLCYGCLRPGHLKTDCKQRMKCQNCSYSHPTILHVDRRTSLDESEPKLLAKSYAAHMGAGSVGHHALPIVPVRLKSKLSDKYLETYAFLDSGSTTSFCTERAAAFLNLQGRRSKIKLLTMGQDTIQDTYEICGLEICSLDGKNTLELPPIYTQSSLPVTVSDVTTNYNLKKWPHLSQVKLQTVNSDVDLLIGINVPKALEPWEVIPCRTEGPFAVKTLFGWVINGPLDVNADHNAKYTCNYIKASTLSEQIRDYFNNDFNEKTIDDMPENSREDNHFLQLVSESITLKDNHYYIDLPFRSPHISLPNNRKQAEQRLVFLARRFGKDLAFKEKYTEFMKKIIGKGYAVKCPSQDLPINGRVWYLPHHGVFHPKKNKLRVVFDCAARYQGTSLNDQLLQGPNLTNTLIGTLLRFRQKQIAIMGDIDSMFYQVKVNPRDRNFQRFLWWENGDSDREPTEYQMTVHLFGSTSSPSCANFALRQTALTAVKGQFNDDVIKTVLRNFYVDDCLKSVESVPKAISLVKELGHLLNTGGFHISKWVSNNKEVMSSIPSTDRAESIRDLDLQYNCQHIERTLGINWCIASDSFSFTVAIKEQPHTRRGILSVVSSIYDPLGFMAPLILKAKMILQELCQSQLGWDDQIPEKYDSQWYQWLNEVSSISNFKVARCITPDGFGTAKSTELHHFSDASEKGYGVVSYLRQENETGEVQCSFIIGKSRVAPLKKVTIPRLELTAATVAVRTDKMLKDELDVAVDKTIFWTDSMSVLRYINNSTSRFQTFVANRLAVIHESTLPTDWHFVPTKLNPADTASRGISVNKELWLKDWIHAPKFLFSKDNWPITPANTFGNIDIDPEIKKAKVNSTLSKQSDGVEIINRILLFHSSWHILKKSVAWILKIKDELRKRCQSRRSARLINKSALSVSDLARAEKAILAHIQKQEFSEELIALGKGNSQVKCSSNLKKLDPILVDSLLCVGGRLHNSQLPLESKHPTILPKNNHVSNLIIRQIHNDLSHAGRNHILSALREKYWLINAPSMIRKLISKCTICRRYNSNVLEQKMANLPSDRVDWDEAPFTKVGVDYFGPFDVKLNRSRAKRYGVIFTCLTSRAIHLEVGFSLDTNSFINALRRFIARRGQITKMISDNGTNFVGAERELKRCIQEWNLNRINEEMLQKGINWQFNPPSGSHHGGVWERLIRSVRKAINSTVREQVLSDDNLLTLFCEVEAILNSRPITRASDDRNDLETLTPNHLLLLKRKPNLPPGLFHKSDNYCKRRWKQVQYLANLFWQRWTREYLPLLQERQKWYKVKRNLKVGDVVLIVDSYSPRNSWPLAIVQETMPDKLGFVRQVKLKTSTSSLVRPVDKLCLLLENE